MSIVMGQQEEGLLPLEGSRKFAVEFDAEQIDEGTPFTGNYNDRLKEAQDQLELLREQAELVEREKRELEELSQLQEAFLKGRDELIDSLSTTSDRLRHEAVDARRRAEDYDDATESFDHHLSIISALRPESWDRSELREELAQALSLVEDAQQDFSGRMKQIEPGLHAPSKPIIGSATPSPVRSPMSATGPQDFSYWLRSGLAFTLPLLVLGVIALTIVYFGK